MGPKRDFEHLRLKINFAIFVAAMAALAVVAYQGHKHENATRPAAATQRG